MRDIQRAASKMFAILTIVVVVAARGFAAEPGAAHAHMAKAGDVIGQLDLSNSGSLAEANALVAKYTRMVAHHLKADKGNLMQWTGAFGDQDITVSDYLHIDPRDSVELQRALSVLTFPKPPSARYTVLYTSLADYRLGEALPTRLSVVEDHSVAPTGPRLAEQIVDTSTLDKTQSDADLALSAVRTLADAVRSQLRVLGVSEPYASTRIGVGVSELEALGRLLRDGQMQITLAASATAPVWQDNYTAVEVTWKAQPPKS
jgi:hypothetical protein